MGSIRSRLPIAPRLTRREAAKLPARARHDLVLAAEIRRVFEANFRVYGVRKVWRQLGREGIAAARCTVARLMRQMGLQGAMRGREVRTTISNPATPCPLDRVNRQFRAPRPNALWLSDFTYVATWQGFVYVAFVIDAYARRIVGWRVSRTAHAGFVLDALEQALADRRPVDGSGLVHHSDRGVQYVSIRYTERLAEAGIEPSVGSVGDSYETNAAEPPPINGSPPDPAISPITARSAFTGGAPSDDKQQATQSRYMRPSETCRRARQLVIARAQRPGGELLDFGLLVSVAHLWSPGRRGQCRRPSPSAPVDSWPDRAVAG